MAYSIINGPAGNQKIGSFSLPDSTSRQQLGLIVTAVDPYWGCGEFMYVKANGAIRQSGLVVITPVVSATGYTFNATEVPDTANLGRQIGVAMTSMTSGDYGWVCIAGLVPVNCDASVAADTTFGIAAAGQGGANSAGKQILNARVMSPATTTVAKASSQATSGSKVLHVTNSDGWFLGAYLSGTGIASGTTVSAISPDGRTVTLSLATTAAVNGTVTATYNNASIFYNVAMLNRSFAQGAIT